MNVDLTGRVALVTGGTQGIGLATGLALARAGADVVLTFRWGTVEEETVYAAFAGLRPPLLVQADVADEGDTAALLDAIAARHPGVDILVSNVAFAPKITGVEDWRKRDLFRAIEYTAWPLWGLTAALQARFGRWPRHVLGVSSDGPENFFRNYDFVAIAKAALETMCRYLAFRLGPEGTRVNVVRSRLVRTTSFDATFGPEHHALLAELGFGDCYTTPEEVASVILALVSGLCDAVTGQVITVDHGFQFFDNAMGVAERRAHPSPTE